MRRTILSLLVLLAAAALALPAAARPLAKVHVVIPRSSAFVLSYLGAKDAGVYRKHGIDLSVDVRPFAGFLAALPSKQCMVTTYAGTAAIAKMNEGLDWVVIGGGLTVMQEVFVAKDSPFKSIPDLRGKRFASWSTGAGAFKAVRATIMDQYGIDVLKDTKFVQASPPALVKLLERGSIDSMFNISSLTINAASQPDKFRGIYSPNAYWKEKTGYPIVWSAPIVAWRSWVEKHPKTAKNFVAATEEAFRWLRKPENLKAAVKKYGALAGVHNQAEAETYIKWLGEKRVFLAHWNQKVIDAQWQFLDMAKRHGILKKVPPAKKYALSLE